MSAGRSKTKKQSAAEGAAATEPRAATVKQVGMVSVTSLASQDGVELPSRGREGLSVLQATLDTMQQGLLVIDRDLRISA